MKLRKPTMSGMVGGSCLKPAFEPVIVARKPFKGTLVDNVLKYGVGGLNIDECRVDFINEEDYKITSNKNQHEKFGTLPITNNNVYGDYSMVQPKNYSSTGRFPANVILTYDETDFEEVCGGFPNTKSSGGKMSMPDLSYIGQEQKKLGNEHKMSFGQVENADRLSSEYIAPSDSGSAARYFYSAKASKRDRDEGLEEFDENLGIRTKAPRKNEEEKTKPRKNIHPTVKPTSLMGYLVRLVTPKNGIVLDPFMGSGSTGKAVAYENIDRGVNYKFIGVELTPEYMPIAIARIKYAIEKGE